MSMQIVQAKNFDVDSVTFSDPRVNTYGGKSVYLNYNRKPLVIQTEELMCQWGLSTFTPKDGGDPKYSMDLSFRGFETNPKIQTLLDRLKELDTKMVETAVDNSLPWFTKKSLKAEVVDEMLYNKTVRYSRDKETGELVTKWPPTWKIKIPYREGRCSTCFYDEDKQEIEMENIHDDLPNILTKKCKVKLLAQCNGVWFAGGKFGLSWKALQVRVKSAGGLSGYSFVDESDDEDESDYSDLSDDDDDDDDDDDEEEEEEDVSLDDIEEED